MLLIFQVLHDMVFHIELLVNKMVKTNIVTANATMEWIAKSCALLKTYLLQFDHKKHYFHVLPRIILFYNSNASTIFYHVLISFCEDVEILSFIVVIYCIYVCLVDCKIFCVENFLLLSRDERWSIYKDKQRRDRELIL